MFMDETQLAVRAIFASSAGFEAKMQALTDLEPEIEQRYRQGLTAVVPVSLMTADDLDFDL